MCRGCTYTPPSGINDVNNSMYKVKVFSLTYSYLLAPAMHSTKLHVFGKGKHIVVVVVVVVVFLGGGVPL